MGKGERERARERDRNSTSNQKQEVETTARLATYATVCIKQQNYLRYSVHGPLQISILINIFADAIVHFVCLFTFNGTLAKAEPELS